MSSKPEVLALIPARSGSKSVPHKNIRPFLGRPLLAHSIAHARAAASVTRVVLSTDSDDYAAIGREHGAEAPFLRPAAISGDHATDLEVFLHALEWLERNEGYRPDLVVHLRPTSPIRDPGAIDQAVGILLSDPALDSVRSVVPIPHPPYKMWARGEDGRLSPLLAPPPGIDEPWNTPRQSLPTHYLQDACIDVTRTRTLVEKRSMTGTAIHGLVLDGLHDIDTERDYQLAEAEASLRAGAVAEGRRHTFVVDIDGVIAGIVPDNDYTRSAPMRENIEAVRRLHAAGHEIILFTARGSLTGLDWFEVTSVQMRAWGVPYDELRFGKPAASFYIDDKAALPSQLQELARRFAPV